MLDIMFELPDQDEGGRYIITEEIARGLEKLFKQPLAAIEAQVKSA